MDSAPGITNGPGVALRDRQTIVGETVEYVAADPLLRCDCPETLLQMSVPAGPGESSTGVPRVQSVIVPELPDLDVVADALHAALTGRVLIAARAVNPLVVRGTPAELGALAGQRVMKIARVGKFLAMDLDRDRVVINPMLTGRFQLAPTPDTKAPSGVAVVLAFGVRHTGVPSDASAWTAGAAWIPADGADPQIRYRDPTQMGKVYVLPAGLERPVPGLGTEEMGPDALGAELTLEAWRTRIRRHPGELKNLLRNQAFVAGIGNAYSDEVLHAARLLPFRKRATLAAEEVDDLYRAMRETLTASVLLLRRRVPPTFETQVRDHLAVHNRKGEACPRCGTKVTQVSAGGFPTGYCRGCQR